MFFFQRSTRWERSNPSFSKIQLRKQVIRTLPTPARQSYGEIKRSGPKILCAASVLSVQARTPQTPKTSLQISAPTAPPKGKPTGEASRLDLQASGGGLGLDQGWRMGWSTRKKFVNGWSWPRKVQKSWLCQPVSCCVRNYMGPAWFSATYGDIKLGWRVTTDTTWCRFRWAGCLEDLEDWLLLGTARKLQMLNELERSLGNHVVCASKTWQTTDTTMITKCETRPAAGMR